MNTLEMLTSEEAARILKVHPKHFRERIACRPDFPEPVRLPSEKGRGTKRWFRDEFEKWVRGLR